MWEPQAAGARGALPRHPLRPRAATARSPVPPGPYAIADLGGDVVALLDRARHRARRPRAALSLGGMVAHVDGGQRTRSASSGSSLLLHVGAAAARRGLWRERAPSCASGGTGAVADAVVERWLTPAFAATRPRRARPAARRCSPPRPPRATPPAARRSSAWTCAATSPRSPRRRSSSPAPTTRDAAASTRRRIAAGIPGARLEVARRRRAHRQRRAAGRGHRARSSEHLR